MPTRLIWVGSDNTTPRLVITESVKGRWAVLSHCWGYRTSDHGLKTTIRTLDRHCERLTIGSLPQSFRDAIAITRKLGLDYLWIDSLCIVQDSEVDWISESAKMGDIYEYAAITLIAEAAENSRQGIASSCRRGRKRLMSDVRATCYSDTLAIQGEIFFKLRKSAWRDTSVYGPLSLRGWTLQEEILSPKILRFTECGVFWRCVESEGDEENSSQVQLLGPDGELRHFKAGGCCYLSALKFVPGDRAVESCHQYWYDQVLRIYSVRSLSYARDKMVAISGIAKRLQPYLGNPNYKAGIWSSDYHRGLLWNVEGEKRRYKEYVAPSWSWACMDVLPEIIWGNKWEVMYYQVTPIATILEVKVENIGADPFGQVISGSLSIEAECLEICWCQISDSLFDIEKEGNPPVDSLVPSFRKLNPFVWESALGEKQCVCCLHETFLAVKVATLVGKEKFCLDQHRLGILILRRPSGGGDSSEYTRAGRALQLCSGESTNISQWPRKRVTVI